MAVAIVLLFGALSVTAQDTITVKTLTFQDTTKRSGTWQFPAPQSYEKVLMEYTLKCDPATRQDNYPCGEWDYLTYTFVTDSTGEFDSTRRTQVNYRVGNATPDSLPYATSFVPQRRAFRETAVSRSGAGEWHDVASGGQSTDLILTPTGGRARFLWKASELTAAGISAGPIIGLRLRSLDSVDNIQLFTVRIGQTSTTTVPHVTDDFTMSTVVRRTVNLDDGPNELPFSSAFQWDGTSNLVVEISCLSAPKTARLEAGPTTPAGIVDDGSRRAYEFRAGDMMLLPQSVSNELSNQITIAFWSYGNAAALPANNNVFEAFNANGDRVLNVHLPWSNGNIYWDAGRSGGSVDRIEKPATAAQYEGRWNHWAFVKNTSTGTMTVYLNGEVFHSGNGKTAPFNGIRRFVFGSGNAGSYPGTLDEIQIWRTALDQQTISTWMHRGITDLHPNINDLVAYYNGETDAQPTEARDRSALNAHAALFGVPTRVQLFNDDFGYLTRSSSGRPYVSFETGTATAQTSRVDLLVNQEPRRTHVIRFRNNIQPRIYQAGAPDHPTIPVDSILVQQAGWLPVIDEAGLKTDSFYVQPTQVLYRNLQPWFDPVVVYEIGRYITPYGIGLDLGPKGFKWIFDVTDYAPILRNNVTLSAGNQQELIDLTFKFIKGTPPRNVTQIDQLWSDRNAEFVNVLAGTQLSPVDVVLDPDAAAFRVKTWSSGHRFSNPTNCAEFCQRIHTLSVNGQTTHEWLLWTECGDNPVYPQGGTWLIDRAGWCPGAPVDLYDHELPSSAAPGSTVSIDYGIKKGAAQEDWGVWDVTGQLIGYGAPNHQLDAAITEVIRPNDWEFYSRLNPVCGQPEIIIQNTGATTLTSAVIEYGVEGQAQSTFNWTGSLGFLQKDTVALPTPAWPSSTGPFRFTARITKPNNGTDAYANNDQQVRTSVMPPVYYSDLEINLRTNKQAALQYEWVLRRLDNNTVIQQGRNLADDSLYVYPFQLENGCYEYELINKEGYGLDFWFLRDQLGSGSLLFKSGGATMKVFEPDFGNRAWMQFIVGSKPTIQTSEDTLRFTTPNIEPVFQTLTITSVTDAPLVVDSVNVFSVRNHFFVTDVSQPLPITLQKGESIDVTVKFDRSDAGSSAGTLRVYSNDERNTVKAVRLLGVSGVSSVDEQHIEHLVQIGVVPNPVSADGDVVIDRLRDGVSVQAEVLVVDAVGNTVATLLQGALESSSLRLPLPTDLASGSYRVILRTGSGWISAPFVIAR